MSLRILEKMFQDQQTEHIHASLGDQDFRFDFNHPGDADPADELNIEQIMEAN